MRPAFDLKRYPQIGAEPASHAQKSHPLMSISRRSFVVSASTTLAVLAGSPRLVLPWRRRYALVIRGGTVFDGVGSPGIEADVAIDKGRVVAIGKNLQDEGAVVIDARGMGGGPRLHRIQPPRRGAPSDDPRRGIAGWEGG